MGVRKKQLKKFVGEANYRTVSRVYNRLRPKHKSEKTVAIMVGFSSWKYEYLSTYLVEYDLHFVDDRNAFIRAVNLVNKYKDTVIITWGYKDAPGLKRFAEKKKVPYYRMEDGFIRSVQLGASHSIPISLCQDSKALYYDSRESSDLETILNTYDFQSDPDLLERAKKSIKVLNEFNISKYNNVQSKDISTIYGVKKKKRILVIGQVEDDASIRFGCSKSMTNNDLVWLAKQENPDAEIFYKPHPDVLFGKRKMQSNPADVQHIARVLTEPLSLSNAMETIDHVYTITSLSGFEALLRGIKVTTFGAPFYSNWGLTDDRQKVSRRKRILSIEELFAAAYILYPMYFNPITKERIELEQALDIMRFMIETEFSANDESAMSSILVGASSRETTFLKRLLPEGDTIESVYNSEVIPIIKANPSHRIFMWNQVNSEEVKQVAEKSGCLLYDVKPAYSTIGNHSDTRIISSVRIHSLSSEDPLIHHLNQAVMDDALLKRAKDAIEVIKGQGLSLVMHPKSKEKKHEHMRNAVLVLGGGNSEEDERIVWLAKLENPEKKVLFASTTQTISSEFQKQIHGVSTVLENPVALIELLPHIEKVYTYDDDGGFEALLYNLPVIVFGNPFYAGWGLTIDRSPVIRDCNRTLEEVFAAAFITHAHYIHPFTREESSLEEILNILPIMKDVEERKYLHDEYHTVTRVDAEVNQTVAPNLEDGIVETSQENLDLYFKSDEKIGVLSKGIKEIPHLEAFLGGELVFDPKKNKNNLSYIAGWGMKPSAKKAIDFSRKYKVPYIALEDGFLRSVGLGVEGSPPLSICVDDIGIYYDATRPSRLENILNSSGWETTKLMKDAQKSLQLIKKCYLSKYNHAPMVKEGYFPNNGKKRILVVDQTFGDMSIELGLATQDSFIRMYNQAVTENPDADIYVKTHPDVISGKKLGNLMPTNVAEGTRFLYENCNPLSLLEQVDKVYVVTSQFGFEALMLGKEVHCFGMPFYAGWGLTKDRLHNDRRQKQRTIDEVFAAAYILYPNYLNPRTNGPGTIFDIIDYLSEETKHKVNAF